MKLKKKYSADWKSRTGWWIHVQEILADRLTVNTTLKRGCPAVEENGDWGEVTSTSNCTDYQARRLNVRYKENGKNIHVHMLNGTAVAVSRAIIAILENFQQADGSIKIPKALVPYTGFDTIKAKT